MTVICGEEPMPGRPANVAVRTGRGVLREGWRFPLSCPGGTGRELIRMQIADGWGGNGNGPRKR